MNQTTIGQNTDECTPPEFRQYPARIGGTFHKGQDPHFHPSSMAISNIFIEENTTRCSHHGRHEIIMTRQGDPRAEARKPIDAFEEGDASRSHRQPDRVSLRA